MADRSGPEIARFPEFWPICAGKVLVRSITSVMCDVLSPALSLYCRACGYRSFLIAATSTTHESRTASARAFVHSLNILIKYARMYGFGHKRTEGQFETAWNELQQGLPKGGEGGFLLGVSDNKLLLDGIPLEAGQAEKSFAQLLTTAGLASLHFSKEVTIEDFTRLVRAFTVAGSKAQDVSKQIKEAFVEVLLERDDKETATAILNNYFACLSAKELEPRRKAAIGLSQLADLWCRFRRSK